MGGVDSSGTWESVLAEAVAADDVTPLDEATQRVLRHHPKRARWWEEQDGFAAYVGDELSLVVRPSARGHGTGRRLLARALQSHEGGIRAWSHSDDPAAGALAVEFGFERVRELWLMVRPGGVRLPPLLTPDGLVLRSYADGDVDGLLRVNAAAFAKHPEQGGLDRAELAERMAEDWFDPAGLLLAADAATGRLLGFHWTKRVTPTLGEVYVVGVDPSAQGRGVGKFVTLAGLHHLTDRGAESIELYVESDNAVARATYEGLGFEHVRTHVMYRR